MKIKTIVGRNFEVLRIVVHKGRHTILFQFGDARGRGEGIEINGTWFPSKEDHESELGDMFAWDMFTELTELGVSEAEEKGKRVRVKV